MRPPSAQPIAYASRPRRPSQSWRYIRAFLVLARLICSARRTSRGLPVVAPQVLMRGSRGRGQYRAVFRVVSRQTAKNSDLILLRTGHWGWPGVLAVPPLCPIQQLVECRAQILAARGQAVLDLGWDHRMNEAADHAVPYQAAKLMDQHLLRYARNRALQLAEPERPIPE